jgi:GNAT superfamily N-acetyltransferase
VTRSHPPAALRAAMPEDIERVRALFLEYAQWLKVDLCFQNFDRELADLPGAYAPPRGRLVVAGAPGEAFGCIALRPLGAAALAEAGEVKRLYVQPSHRGEGWGRRLAETVIADARVIGYRELKLDTFDWMTDARRLYTELGFRACAPYYDNPMPGVVYMSLAL